MTKTILAVLAHPDDESFGMGGTLALYAQKGYDTYYVCATRGEAGSLDEEFLKGYKDTAELRTDELMRAAKVLGLKEVFFLGYRDSGMPGTEENKHPNAQINHSIDEVAGKVVRYIRELKPDIVITFDPIGDINILTHPHSAGGNACLRKSGRRLIPPGSWFTFQAKSAVLSRFSTLVPEVDDAPDALGWKRPA